MGRGKVVLVMLTAVFVSGPLEAATGGGVVRAALRVRAAIEADVVDPATRARLANDAEELLSDLRGARRDDRRMRHLAYVAAGDRARLLGAELGSTASARLLTAVHALEEALGRAASCGCRAATGRPMCGRDGQTYPSRCAQRCAGVKGEHAGACR
jgi:hypothetical protein